MVSPQTCPKDQPTSLRPGPATQVTVRARIPRPVNDFAVSAYLDFGPNGPHYAERTGLRWTVGQWQMPSVPTMGMTASMTGRPAQEIT